MDQNTEENKSENTLINQGQNNNQKQIAGAIVLAGLLIAGAVLLKGNLPVAVNSDAGNNNAGVDLKSIRIKPVDSNEHIFGNIDAKIVIIEYSDLECPFCKVFHQTMQTIVEKNQGNVAWVYRHFPLYQASPGRPPLHSKALKEAEATECAWEQGGNDAFWRYTDRIFEITPSNNGLDLSELPKIAQYIGINVTSFNTCLGSGKYKTAIDKSIEEGSLAGVQGTPKSFILKNSKVIDTIDGAEPLEMVNLKIQNALK